MTGHWLLRLKGPFGANNRLAKDAHPRKVLVKKAISLRKI
jgi:hypothetical protein